MSALGHRPQGQSSGIGASRNHRIERIATRGHLLPADERRRMYDPAPVSLSNGLTMLHNSPWVDSNDSRASASAGMAPPQSHVRCVPLLGRYDLLRIERARTLAPSALPFLSVREKYHASGAHAGTLSQATTAGKMGTAPFFIRQQFGLLFSHVWEPPVHSQTVPGLAAQQAWACLVERMEGMPGVAAGETSLSPYEWYIPARETVAMAILSVQLAHRSGRLTLPAPDIRWHESAARQKYGLSVEWIS